MKQLFFSAITAEQKALLNKAGVVFTETEYEATGEQGVIIAKNQIDQCLKILSLRILLEVPLMDGISKAYVTKAVKEWSFFDWFKTAADEKAAVNALLEDKNIGAAILKLIGYDYPVSTGHWNGENQSRFVKIAAEILRPAVLKAIVIDVPHGDCYEPVGSNDCFYIHIWSAPPGVVRDNNTPHYIWQQKVACPDPSFRDFRGGIKIKDGKYTVATLMKNDLYINHDICHYGRESELEIFRLLLKKTAEIIRRQPRYLRRLVKESSKLKTASVVCGSSVGVQKGIESAAKIIASRLKTKVFIYNPNGVTCDICYDSQFHVYLWSYPGGRNKCAPPDTLFDIKINAAANSFFSREKGIVIFDDNGIPAAELIRGNNLFIYHDLKEAKDPSAVIRRIFSEAAGLLTTKTGLSRYQKNASKQLAKNRDLYVKGCSQRIEAALTGCEEEIAVLEASRRKLQQQLVIAIRKIEAARAKKSRFDSEQYLDDFAAEFDKLLTLPKIKLITVDNNLLNVYTDIIYCQHPKTGNFHEIGAFRLQINLDGKNDGLRFFNLSRQVSGYNKGMMQAPHVFDDGKACLGNIQEVIPELIAGYQFYELIMLAIAFLESVNIDDAAGKFIDNWPIAEFNPDKN